MFAQIVIVMTILRLDSNSKAVAWLQGTFWFRACSVCENCTLGSTSSGPNVCLQGKWDLFLCAYCLLSPELFFIILPDYNKAWNKNFPSVFLLFDLFPHICGFLVNQLPQLYQELIKDFTQFCCCSTHGLHMWWSFMESICLEKHLEHWTHTGHHHGPVGK